MQVSGKSKPQTRLTRLDAVGHPADVRFLQTGNPALVEFLLAAIRERGPLSFASFMEAALYHPEHGYYSSGRAVIGREGDYFTSVSVGPLFGRLLAAQFAEMWEALDRPNDFKIVEQGAYDGVFARDVLDATGSRNADFHQALTYEIIEPFPVLQARQAATLAGFEEKVTWCNSVAELAPFCGVHFSNELIDAMPVHLVKWTGSEWLERHVSERDGQFVDVDLPIASPELAVALEKIPQPLPENYETECNLNALRWLESMAPRLERGFILAADYGYSRAEFYAPQRSSGTVRCYAVHRIVPSPLLELGNADITSHVDWTSLAEHAERLGLNVAGFADQHHFITGLLAGPAGEELVASLDAKAKRALQTLLHPGHLGMKFQFLALAKGVSGASLCGLRFAKAGPQI